MEFISNFDEKGVGDVAVSNVKFSCFHREGIFGVVMNSKSEGVIFFVSIYQ